MPSEIPERSGRLYSAVTAHWPRIAGGVVVFGAGTGWVLDALTVSGALETYGFVWAATTAGIWFLFDKAESAMSDSVRARVADRLRDSDLGTSLGTIPAQFALLFDKVFGERHLSLACFARSCVASVLAAGLFGLVFITTSSLVQGGQFGSTHVPRLDASDQIQLLVMVGLLNLLPDYLSLWETRWIMDQVGRKGRLLRALMLDALVTALISAYVWSAVVGLVARLPLAPIEMIIWLYFLVIVGVASSFFTSAWLWLYAASVLVSRTLLRMNDGLGFLLRATDVEKQPFRSMGFVSVIIVTGVFLLGLPVILM